MDEHGKKYPVGTKLKLVTSSLGVLESEDTNISITNGNIVEIVRSVEYLDSYMFKGEGHDRGWVKSFVENLDNFQPIKFTTWEDKYKR